MTRPIESATPFGTGTVSVGLHPGLGLVASDQVSRLLREARTAANAGFDGVTISEHHAGFPGYLPQPVAAASWILATCEPAWAAPAPVLLGLRSPRLLAEELAWTAARFPGRLGVAVAPGYAASDYSAVGVPFEGRLERFPTQLAELLAALNRNGPLADDPAIAEQTLPPSSILIAANSRTSARRAASLGLGLLFPGGEPVSRLGGLAATYRSAGGSGPIVGIVAVTIGTAAAATRTRLDEAYVEAAATGMRQAAGFARPAFAGSPETIAGDLIEHCTAAGITALNVRLPSTSGDDACHDLECFADRVLPDLRRQLAAPVAPGPHPSGVTR